MSDLIFGIKLTADGKQLVGEVRASREEFDKLGTSVQRAAGKMASDYSGLNKTVKEHAAAVTDTDGKVGKLLDRYDPLGAKLRQLQADFKALDAAASTGKIAGRDDARVDAVYVQLQKEINAVSAATGSFGEVSGKAARSAGQLRMATQQLPMQFTDIWVSLAAGQSPMMVMLQQGTQIKDSFGGIGGAAGAMGRYMLGLVNPITLVTAALAAGVYAWYKYENVAVESAEKTMDALEKAIGDGGRLASMSKEALDGAIADAEVSIEAKKALIDALRWDPERRFKLKASVAAEAEYNKEIKLTTSRLVEMKDARDRLGDGTDKLREQSSFARREALAKEIALLETNNGKQQAGSREYLANLSAIADKKKQLADMDKKGRKKDTSAALASRIEAEAFKAQMEAMGVSAAQIRVYELARRGATREETDAAQASANLEMAADAEAIAAKESAAAWDESAKVIDKVNTASKEYVNQLQFENSLLGLSTLEVQKRTEARKIDLALEKELLALRRNDKLKADPAALKAAEDAAIKAAGAAKAGAEVEIEARDRVTRSWEYGSSEAIRKYNDQVSNSAAQAESLYSKAFRSAEDAVTRFAMTGKLSIRDFASTVIEEFYRIKVAQPMVSAGAGFLGDLFDGLFGSTPAGASASTVASFGATPTAAGTTDYMALAGYRADGGSVAPNSLYMVNEKRPEVFSSGGNDYLMTGGRGGFVTPLAQAKSSSGYGQSLSTKVIVNVIEAPGKGGQQQQRNEGGTKFIDVFVEQIKSAIAGDISRGSGAVPAAIAQSYGLNRVAGSY